MEAQSEHQFWKGGYSFPGWEIGGYVRTGADANHGHIRLTRIMTPALERWMLDEETVMSKRLFQGHLVQDLLDQSQTSLWDGKGLSYTGLEMERRKPFIT